MEYKEFNNPESKDYDINITVDENYGVVDSNKYSIILADMIGVLEDISEDELLSQYGITMDEYLNPNADVIIKVKLKLDEGTKKRIH